MKKNDNNLFYTCSLIELIGRTARQKRKDVVTLMGEKIISHIYHHADTLHCEPIAKIADYYIDFCHIPVGEFDNIASCKYIVPSYWDIGKVYARLIEDIRKDDVISALIRVYNSPVSDSISYYNSDFYYQPRGFIKEQFLSEENADAGKTSKKPAIRFRGFTDPWEQRKLGEIADKVLEKNNARLFSETFTNSAENGIISQQDYFDHAISNEANLDGYYVVREEDFVYNPRISVTAPVGPINRNKLRRVGVMSPLYTVFRTHNVDNTFLEYFFKSVYWHSYMNFNGDSGARADRFSIKNSVFFEMPIPYPEDREQTKIGSYLTGLDRLITLHQRKYDKLVKIKKSMLEKLFPKNDSKFPEIRFSGFTDPWEQRKLGEIAIFNPPCTIPDTFRYVDLESVIGTEMISCREEQKDNAPSRAQRLARYGDLFYQTVRPYQRNNYLFEKDTGTYVFSTGYAQIRSEYDGYFLLCLVQTNPFVNNVLDQCTGTSYPAINSKDLAQMDIRLPQQEISLTLPKRSEEQKIGAFFRNLDRLITLHQRKLEKLKKIKKSCLEKMFA